MAPVEAVRAVLLPPRPPIGDISRPLGPAQTIIRPRSIPTKIPAIRGRDVPVTGRRVARLPQPGLASQTPVFTPARHIRRRITTLDPSEEPRFIEETKAVAPDEPTEVRVVQTADISVPTPQPEEGTRTAGSRVTSPLPRPTREGAGIAAMPPLRPRAEEAAQRGIRPDGPPRPGPRLVAPRPPPLGLRTAHPTVDAGGARLHAEPLQGLTPPRVPPSARRPVEVSGETETRHRPEASQRGPAPRTPHPTPPRLRILDAEPVIRIPLAVAGPVIGRSAARLHITGVTDGLSTDV